MKNLISVFLIFFVFEMRGQDSSSTKQVLKIRKNEIGINVLPVLVELTGAMPDHKDLINITYRRLIKNKHALRITSGVYTPEYERPDYIAAVISKSNSVAVIQNNKVGGINLQAGIGYEYIIGRRRLKHVVGLDLTYNYQKQIISTDYSLVKDSIGPNNFHQSTSSSIDTGKVVKNNYYNKIGANLFYSLRYPLSKKWLMTASVILSWQTYRTQDLSQNVRIYDFNVNGLVSEVSLFYRF